MHLDWTALSYLYYLHIDILLTITSTRLNISSIDADFSILPNIVYLQSSQY